jgi:hypothetical protein
MRIKGIPPSYCIRCLFAIISINFGQYMEAQQMVSSKLQSIAQQRGGMSM